MSSRSPNTAGGPITFEAPLMEKNLPLVNPRETTADNKGIIVRDTPTARQTPTKTSQTYTNLHLSAITFLHPPNIPESKQCPCKAASRPTTQAVDQNKVVRVYHTEPSPYGYNSGCYLIKESRYDTFKQWYGPNDDLVADDAIAGSSIASVGSWVDITDEIWETRVYYVDKTGILRERTNRSYFAPSAKDDFDAPLHKPEELVTPTPGWKLTPVRPKDDNSGRGFPSVTPAKGSKLAAVRSSDGKIHVFFEALDNTVWELLYDSQQGERGWASYAVLKEGQIKAGSSLTAVAGGWAEVRLFFVTPADTLAEVYKDDHTNWVAGKLPIYKLPPTAMISAIAWNHASPYFGIRIYTADDNDELHEFCYLREAGGWLPGPQPMTSARARGLDTGAGASAPLSAVTAVLVDDVWKTKVYFHPRRAILEWDVCSHAPPGIHKPSKEAENRRAIEEQTRAKIAEEAERKRKAEQKRQEEARKEEERRRAEQARLEEERARTEAKKPVVLPEPSQAAKKQLQEYKKVKSGGKIDLAKNPELDKILKSVTKCEQGYEWRREEGGWRCAGGRHFITDEQFEALARGK